MSDIKLLINACLSILNTKLTFAPYSFTILQAFIALAVLSIIIYFVQKILS